MDFVLVDRDGDTASSTIYFSAAGGSDHPPIVRDDHVITNISGGSGTNIVIPDYALLYNDGDTDGQTIAITGAIPKLGQLGYARLWQRHVHGQQYAWRFVHLHGLDDVACGFGHWRCDHRSKSNRYYAHRHRLW